MKENAGVVHGLVKHILPIILIYIGILIFIALLVYLNRKKKRKERDNEKSENQIKFPGDVKSKKRLARSKSRK